MNMPIEEIGWIIFFLIVVVAFGVWEVYALMHPEKCNKHYTLSYYITSMGKVHIFIWVCGVITGLLAMHFFGHGACM